MVSLKKLKKVIAFSLDGKCVNGSNLSSDAFSIQGKGDDLFFRDTVAFALCQFPCPIHLHVEKFQKVFAGSTESLEDRSLPTPGLEQTCY